MQASVARRGVVGTGLLLALACCDPGVPMEDAASIDGATDSRASETGTTDVTDARDDVSRDALSMPDAAADAGNDGTARDNCPGVVNPTQSDRDGDGLGDACDCRPDDRDAPGSATNVCLSIEAEDYSALAPPLRVDAQASASGQRYVNSPDGAGATGEVRYDFVVPRAGAYALWARVAAATGNDDSLSVTVDETAPVTWTVPLGTVWHWSRVTPGTTPYTVNLAAGMHSLRLQPREDGITVDKLFVTTDLARLPAIRRVIDIDTAWSGVTVGFDLLSWNDRQYVAYYNRYRQMTVAQRAMTDAQFTSTALPNVYGGWDSHNYVTLAVDAANQMHLSGDMHASPLVYFRTRTALDSSTFVAARMVGALETETTYPVFFAGPSNRFLFSYRSGVSGDGDTYYNAYDPATSRWTRYLGTPIFDGGSGSNSMSAYPSSPARGPDGLFHMVWVWRDTPDAATNHHVSYARSADLIHWESVTGAALHVPLTLTPPTVVDPVPAHGGALNGAVHLGFNASRRAIVSYMKYDAAGHSQIYNARLEMGAWRIHPATHWPDRWDFGGGGTLESSLITFSGVTADAAGHLSQSFVHWRQGSGVWSLDPVTLAPIGVVTQRGSEIPPELSRIVTPRGSLPADVYADWIPVFRTARGTGPRAGRYFLRWEALSSNRDQPRYCNTAHTQLCAPTPSTLQLYEFEE